MQKLKAKGFGKLISLKVYQFRWYFVEYNDKNNDTKEVHWLKVKKQSAKKRDIFKRAVHARYADEAHDALEDNLAICYVAYYLEDIGFDKGFYEAFLFKARELDKTESKPYPIAIWRGQTYSEQNNNLGRILTSNVSIEKIEYL